MNNELITVISISRFLLGFVFIYHGLVPKIFWLDEVEIALVEASGAGVPASVVSPVAGVAEVVLGLLIILSRSVLPIYIAAILLVNLLLYVVFMMPGLLSGAFNPVSTNILALGLCYFIVRLSNKAAA